MLPITEIRKCLQSTMTKANLGIFLSLATSFLCVRYEITTRGLSRYCDYSLRQIFRFLVTDQSWLLIRISLFKSFFYQKEQVYLLAIAECRTDEWSKAKVVIIVLV